MKEYIFKATGSFLFVTIFCVSLVGCQLAPKAPDLQTEPTIDETPQKQDYEPDLQGLAEDLKLDSNEVGYKDSRFNSCKVGRGFPQNMACKDLYLVAIHFRLQCRNSEGTVNEVTLSELEDIGDTQVQWSTPGLSGQTTTQIDGTGKILMIAAVPPRNQRLRLSTRGQYLIMKANQLGRVIVPKDWCP